MLHPQEPRLGRGERPDHRDGLAPAAEDVLRTALTEPGLPARVIVADSCRELRSVVRAMLTPVVKEITEVCDGRQLFWTLEALLSRRRDERGPVVVVADVVMQVYGAMEVMEAWHEAEEAPVPFVATAGSPDAALRERLASVNGLLLRKPFTTQELRASVRTALRV